MIRKAIMVTVVNHALPSLHAGKALQTTVKIPLMSKSQSCFRFYCSWTKMFMHCELDSRRRSNLWSIAGATLWPRSSSSFHFTHKYEKSKVIWWSKLYFRPAKVNIFVRISDLKRRFNFLAVCKVVRQGKLIAIAYSLRTYWNQFSLGSICKQE